MCNVEIMYYTKKPQHMQYIWSVFIAFMSCYLNTKKEGITFSSSKIKFSQFLLECSRNW